MEKKLFERMKQIGTRVAATMLQFLKKWANNETRNSSMKFSEINNVGKKVSKPNAGGYTNGISSNIGLEKIHETATR